MSGPRSSADTRIEETRGGIDGGSEDFEAIRAFVAKGPMFFGSLRMVGNHVPSAEPACMVP